MPLVTDIHTGKKAAVLLLCCVVTLPLWKYPCTCIFHNHILNVHADLRRNNRLVVCVISLVSFFFDAYLCPCSLPHFLLHLLLYTEPWIACKLHCCFLVKKKKRKSVEETHSFLLLHITFTVHDRMRIERWKRKTHCWNLHFYTAFSIQFYNPTSWVETENFDRPCTFHSKLFIMLLLSVLFPFSWAKKENEWDNIWKVGSLKKTFVQGIFTHCWTV